MLRERILTADQHVPNENGQESVPMSAGQSRPPAAACSPTSDILRQQINQRLDEIIGYCFSETGPTSFLEFETALLGLLRLLGGLLIQFSLRARHDGFDTTAWTRDRGYRVADPAARRTLKTSRGPVVYVRAFLVPRRGGGPGVHPLDVALGLSRDAYTPLSNSRRRSAVSTGRHTQNSL